jgi:Ca2+-binding EF-hand superfamily protein
VNINERLVSNINKKHIEDLYDLYIKSDIDKQGILSFQNFCVLLRKIDESLTEEECNLLLKKFDENGDNQISFK